MRTKLPIIFAAVLFGVAAAHAQGSPRPKATLNTEIQQQFPIQSSGAITPQAAQKVTQDIVASTQSYAGVNAQTGTSYTFALSDYGQLVTFNNPSAIAATLPAASSAGFYPFSFYVSNIGAGGVTITPTNGTIAGQSSYSVAQGGGVFVVSDGTNWQILGQGGASASGCTVSGVTTGYVFNNGANGCSTSTNLTTSGTTDTEHQTLNVTSTTGLQFAGNTMTFPGSAAMIPALNIQDQTLSGGANVTSLSLGTFSSGTLTIDCGKRPGQYLTNNGAFTIQAPSNDGSCDTLIINGSSAGAISFSGFTVGANTGAPLNTTVNDKFILSVREIDGVATYLVVALQ